MEATNWIWMDGRFVRWEDAQVHVLTHTLHYGLGAFEGIRCYLGEGGRSAIFRLRDHVRRLFESMHILGTPIPLVEDVVVDACVEIVRRNELQECYIRPLAYLGDGEMGLSAKNPVRVAIAAWKWGAYLGAEGVARGIRVKTSSFHRFHVNTFMGKAKTVGNYVNSILAAREAADGRSAYAASKHALHGFFDSLRSEVAADGVGVMLACPAFIATGIERAALGADARPMQAPRQTSGREATPADVAERILADARRGRRLSLPSRTSRAAWWLSRLAPAFYERQMLRRQGAQFDLMPRSPA